MAMYGWFTYEQLWFSIVMLVYQRVMDEWVSHVCFEIVENSLFLESGWVSHENFEIVLFMEYEWG